MTRTVRLLLTLGIGVALWFAPTPQGVTPDAWHLVAIMTATIAGFILNPFPIGAVAFMGLIALSLTRTMSMGDVLSGFSNTLLWLIVMAFMFSRAFLNTGLGKRIALTIISLIGDSTPKVGYAFTLSGCVLSPVIPSGTARAGGIIFPILRGICSSMGSEPGNNPGKAGRFLIQTYFQAECFISYLFMTSMAGNVLVVALAKDAGTDLTWGTWALAALVPGLVGVITVPLAMYHLCPPEQKKSPEAKAEAIRGLAELGPMSFHEKVLCVIFCSSTILWATGDFTGLSSTLVGLMAVATMIIFGILSWQDVLGEKSAWDTFVWMGALITMAGALSSKGFIGWLGDSMGGLFSGMDWMLALFIIALFFNYTQYAFASSTAHLVGLYSACLAVAIAAGAPAMLAILLLAFLANTPAALTQYSCGFAPIFFEAGYFSVSEWWRVGFIMSWLHFFTVCIFGPFWWKFLGLW